MGEKDSLTKRFMSRPDVFADAFNYLIYDGESVIKPEQLHEMDTTSIVVPFAEEYGDSHRTVQKSRDLLKEWICMADGRAAYMILGIENQTNIHYAMPVRNMLYDAIQYENQVKSTEYSGGKRSKEGQAADPGGEYLSGFRKTDRLKPVITLVIYFGDKVWDGPESLYEMFGESDEKLLAFVPDYRINLIAPAAMSDEKLEKLTSEFKEGMIFIKHCADWPKLHQWLEQDERFHSLTHDTAAMLSAVTGTKITMKESEEKVDMCLAIQQAVEERKPLWIKEGIEQGRRQERERLQQSIEQGIERGIEQERLRNVNAMIALMRSLNLSEQDIFDKIKGQFGLTDGQTAEYMESAKA